MAEGEPGTRGHGGQEHLAEVLVVLCSVEQRQGLPETVYRPTIGALRHVGQDKVLVRQRVQDDLPARRRVTAVSRILPRGMVQ